VSVPPADLAALRDRLLASLDAINGEVKRCYLHRKIYTELVIEGDWREVFRPGLFPLPLAGLKRLSALPQWWHGRDGWVPGAGC